VLHECAIRANLHYKEEEHRSRNLGEWSNMIGYEMGTSPAGVYTMPKISPVGILKHE
jgi:hypothetical protein